MFNQYLVSLQSGFCYTQNTKDLDFLIMTLKGADSQGVKSDEIKSDETKQWLMEQSETQPEMEERFTQGNNS